MQQASLRDASGADYLRTARAKGLGPAAVWIRHAGRNAAVPVATALGVSAGHLLGGAVLTETVFGWPGLGRYLVEGVGARDYPVVQGFVIGFCLVRVAASLATDLACAALDPRLRDVAARGTQAEGRAA
jgi:peptide/nickel transport system permease protein